LRRAKQEQGSDEQVNPKRSKQMFGYPTPSASLHCSHVPSSTLALTAPS